MRQVEVYKYEVRARRDAVPEIGSNRVYINENLEKAKILDFIGKFHQWGLNIINAEVSYTVAIIEDDNGYIRMTHPSMIRFVND